MFFTATIDADKALNNVVKSLAILSARIISSILKLPRAHHMSRRSCETMVKTVLLWPCELVSVVSGSPVHRRKSSPKKK